MDPQQNIISAHSQALMQQFADSQSAIEIKQDDYRQIAQQTLSQAKQAIETSQKKVPAVQEQTQATQQQTQQLLLLLQNSQQGKLDNLKVQIKQLQEQRIRQELALRNLGK